MGTKTNGSRGQGDFPRPVVEKNQSPRRDRRRRVRLMQMPAPRAVLLLRRAPSSVGQSSPTSFHPHTSPVQSPRSHFRAEFPMMARPHPFSGGPEGRTPPCGRPLKGRFIAIGRTKHEPEIYPHQGLASTISRGLTLRFRATSLSSSPVCPAAARARWRLTPCLPRDSGNTWNR